MPPRQLSRHIFAQGVPNSAGQLWLMDRIPFRFREFSDNRRHTVIEGDTLYHLAARYFPNTVRPAGLWWVIADFQPQPVHDPTVQLLPGRVLVIPSERTLADSVFAEARRRDSIL